MEKISVLLIALLLMVILPVTALAEGETEEPTPSPSPTQSQEEPIAPVNLSIDNVHVYDGMDKAFKDGYIPTVKDGKAIVVLPLVASGEILDDAITVTPDLGGASSVFVYKNYQKTVLLADNAVAGGGKVSSYLIRFDLPLVAERLNGVYPISINVEAHAKDSSPIQQSFTTYVTIADGKDPNAPEPTEEPEKPKSQPKIIISRYSINPSPVTAGDEFTATITFENISDDQSVKNMMVAVSTDSSNLVMQNDSNTIYVGKLGKGDTTDIEITYKTDLVTAAGRYNVLLNMEYENSEAVTLNSSGTVMVEVTQPLRVEMDEPDIEVEVNAGDTMTLSFQVMNLGRSAVYNVRIDLNAPGLIPSETTFIGNMESGTSMTGEMDVFIGTKNMSDGNEGDDKYGVTSGTVTMIYEDEAGNEYTDETEFTTTINEPVITASNNEVDEEPETAGQWWISVIVVVIAGLAAYIIIRKKRQEKSNADF